MRQIVLDTETTGLEPELGHRIIEIGCVEIVNRRVTGRTFHRYLNPERAIDEGAMAVHGIKRADLDDKPKFAEIAEYCCYDVKITRLVHEYGAQNRHVHYRNNYGKKMTVPVKW